MNRKYLDDIGVTERPDTWFPEDTRQEAWRRAREVYSFDEREIWNLDFSFYLWLYERLRFFLDCNAIDLEFHKFDYKGQIYTQKQMIEMMIERLEFYFSKKYNDLNEQHTMYVSEISKIWAEVLPAMWC